MSYESKHFNALWRSSANEGVPYSEDFPEALLTLPEFIDGALGAGKASQVDITFDITNKDKCILIVEDNGVGITSVNRITRWAAAEIGDNLTENIYGHGSKKALTKFCPDYNDADWTLEWRKKGNLNKLTAPFLGKETNHIDDNDEDETTCKDNGTKWTVNFKNSVLGKYNTPKKLMPALEEIIRTRYEPSDYHEYTININVINGSEEIKESSSSWKSLKETLDFEITFGNVIKTHEKEIQVDNTTVKFVSYKITADGRKYKGPLDRFPKYGCKNMNSTRVHISRLGRYIEHMPYSKFLSKESHNSMNGQIGFIQFYGVLPKPCTTKVKFFEECPIFKKMTKEIKKYYESIKITTSSPTTKSAAKTPAAKPSAAKTPAAKTSAAKTPATKTPSTKTPAAKTSAAKTPATKPPATKPSLPIPDDFIPIRTDSNSMTSEDYEILKQLKEKYSMGIITKNLKAMN